MPRIGRPSSIRAMFTVNSPFLLMNSLVPSSGSTSQNGPSPERRDAARRHLLLGHDRRVGRELAQAARITGSAASSATVTGSGRPCGPPRGRRHSARGSRRRRAGEGCAGLAQGLVGGQGGHGIHCVEGGDLIGPFTHGKQASGRHIGPARGVRPSLRPVRPVARHRRPGLLARRGSPAARPCSSNRAPARSMPASPPPCCSTASTAAR